MKRGKATSGTAKRLSSQQAGEPVFVERQNDDARGTKRRRQEKHQTMQEERRKQRREQILDAAERLFRERGQNFTLKELAGEAQTSRVTLYQYFAGKQEILRVLSEERGVVWEEDVGLDVRTRILQAARKVFGEQGFWRATMESIAQEAGVGVVTVYRHFQDKSTLIGEFLQSIRPHQALDELHLASRASLEEALAVFATKAVRIMSENRDIVRLSMAQIDGGRFEELEALRKRPGRTAQRLAAFFAEQMEQGKIYRENPRELAICFLGMLMSFAWIVPSVEGEMTADPEHIGALVARIFVRGVRQKP